MLLWNSSKGNTLNNSEWSEGPMNGEGCDLSVPSPALAGYLGNADNRGLISGTCPLCSAKGQINVLRSYAFNFEESVTLCTSPLCLFPLVSEPLDNTRAILSSSQDIQGCKRKLCLTPESNDPDPSSKHWKKENTVSHVECQNVNVGDCRVSANSVGEGLLIQDHEKQQVLNNPDNPERPKDVHSTSSDTVLFDDAQINEPVSSSQQTTVQDIMQMVPSLQHLFWRNKHNLCWLDSLLVALVHSTVLKEASCDNVCSIDTFLCKNYAVKYLCATYKKLYAFIKAKEQHCEDKIVRVPSNDLLKAEQELEDLRMSVFQFLQPKLQCKLGQKETPVFALPLLLRSDDWANSLFQHTGQWEFRCTLCGHNFSMSMEKTVTTFTQVASDWHPLRAVHRARCSKCNNKNQKRKLVLKRMSSVLALHFVEGLPRRDISKYEFDFHGTHYNIRTIIQYNEQREHFVTWIHQPDGLWLEFDDLKYPHCITHKRFTLPASQFHLIFWEAESSKESLPPDTLPDDTPTQKSKVVDVFEDVTNSVPDDACIIEALTGKEMNEAANGCDSSIGSTTLLDTFEGLSHSDIVTLTLVDANESQVTGLKEMVTGTAEFSIKETSDPLEKSSFHQIPCSGKNKKGDDTKVSSTPEIIFPSVIKEPNSVYPPKVGKCPPAHHSTSPSASSLPYSAQQHPSHQSTPLRVPLCAMHPKVDLKFDGNEALLAKPAELFGGYKTKESPIQDVSLGLVGNIFVKSKPIIKKPFSCPGGTRTTGPASTHMKSDSQNMPNSSSSKEVLSTDALRLKLMKRLKAKKKKLAKLNQLLDKEERESTPKPDSTYISSPYSVTSITSACDSPPFDNFLAEFLSPGMGSSNLSPDSTGHLETLTSRQSAVTLDISCQENSKLPVHVLSDCSPNSDNFLDEFMSVSRDESVIGNAELNALDIFF